MRKVKMATTSRMQVTSSLKCRNWSAQLWQITTETRCHSMYTQMEFYPITDVQPVKDVAPHVRETTVKLLSVGDESSSSIHYLLQFICCGLLFGAPSSRQSLWNTWLEMSLFVLYCCCCLTLRHWRQSDASCASGVIVDAENVKPSMIFAACHQEAHPARKTSSWNRLIGKSRRHLANPWRSTWINGH